MESPWARVVFSSCYLMGPVCKLRRVTMKHAVEIQAVTSANLFYGDCSRPYWFQLISASFFWSQKQGKFQCFNKLFLLFKSLQTQEFLFVIGFSSSLGAWFRMCTCLWGGAGNLNGKGTLKSKGLTSRMDYFMGRAVKK